MQLFWVPQFLTNKKKNNLRRLYYKSVHRTVWGLDPEKHRRELTGSPSRGWMAAVPRTAACWRWHAVFVLLKDSGWFFDSETWCCSEVRLRIRLTWYHKRDVGGAFGHRFARYVLLRGPGVISCAGLHKSINCSFGEITVMDNNMLYNVSSAIFRAKLRAVARWAAEFSCDKREIVQEI